MTSKTEDEKDVLFWEEYQELCKNYKRGLTTTPAWRFSEDGNDFRLVINISVSRWNEE